MANDVVRGKVEVKTKTKTGKKKVRKVKNTAIISRMSRGGPLSWSLKRSKTLIIKRTYGMEPGTYKTSYTVKDTAGRKDKADIYVTVLAKPVSVPPVTPPFSTPTPVPTSGNLSTLIEALPVAAEVRTGYDRETWKHWNNGLYADGCDTRSEVLISEAIVPVAGGTKCAITTANTGGGSWYSYYDGVTSNTPSTTVDIDHLVPLAEAHDSGAYAWDAATKEAYANDQGDRRSLVAVSASSNRSKSDQDPGEWWPLLERCRYAVEWVAVKTRWSLAVDAAEKDALLLQASQCGGVTVEVIPR